VPRLGERRQFAQETPVEGADLGGSGGRGHVGRVAGPSYRNMKRDETRAITDLMN
jgi:hypothetical protein